MISLRNKVLTSFSWSFLSQLATLVLHLVFTVLLARMLTPEVFGLFGMVMVVVGFCDIFNDFGLSSHLIRVQELDKGLASTLFYINLIVGLLLSVGFFFLAEHLSFFFEEPSLIPPARMVAPVFLITAIASIPHGLLQRHMDFKGLFYIQFVSVLIGGLTAIVMAYLNYGVLSLVAQYLMITLVSTVLIIVIAKWKPDTVFVLSKTGDTLRYARGLFADNFLSYVAKKLDYLLIGKYLGKYELGIYTRGYALMHAPVQNIAGAIAKVLFPSMAGIQDDIDRIRSIYLKIIQYTVWLVFPLVVGLVVVAEPLIIVVLGEDWRDVIPVVRVLAVVGAVQAITKINTSIFMALGKTRLMFKVGLFSKLIVIAGIIIGLKWGLMGVAGAYLIASLLAFIPELFHTCRLMILPFAKWFSNVAAIMVYTIVMLISIVIAHHYLKPFSYSVQLLIIPFGMLIYVLMAWVRKDKVVITIKALVDKLLSR